MKTKKILITYEIPYPRFDGVSNALKNLQPYFVEHNINVLLVLPKPTVRPAIQHKPYRSLEVPGVVFPAYLDCTFGLPLLSSGELLERFMPDLVHALAPFALGRSVIAASRGMNIPTVGTFTTNIPEFCPYYGLGMLRPLMWKTYKLIHNQCDINLAPSEVVKKEMDGHGISNTSVWGRGIDIVRFSPDKRSDAVRQYLTQGHPRRKILLYVGRLSKEKNLVALYKAVKGLKNVHTVIVGDGPYRKHLESLFSEENCTFTGFLDGDELATAYSSADLFVTPSLTEGFANVVLESLASCIPAVGFDSNGVAELIINSGGGLLAEPQNHLDLREKIIAILESPSLADRLSMKGRAYAKMRTWDQCFRELLQYYESLIM
ncbi:MAG: glycosyltransferase family 1 protein [Chloroflexi bacterium]|nr:glycosyltransferase family 1 protein [Chloroflexota bacterium]